jgi:Carboxypeptidase regulatory-like domain
MSARMSMISSVVLSTLVVLSAILTLPATAYAQEATLSGTVTDSTGGVLPGVTVTAVHEASGNTFVAVTDDHGAYRLPLRTGVYRITMELSGFATQTRSLELLVGQQGVVNLQLAPSTVQESVTVTGEAPLIDVPSSALSGNIDPRQVQELPVNGRNWMDLSILAPGSRANASTDQPTPETTAGRYQINVDGQQVTNLVVGGFGQPRYSRDSIAEFELVSNRFDVTQGRSTGVQVNAITKSGTNTPAGSFSGYFRSDSFNAADPVAHRVLPYSDQQLSGTFGGPIVRDKIHFFANYEYERNPQTKVYTTPYPRFNTDLFATDQQHTGAGRVDAQMSSRTRLSGRYSKWTYLQPFRTGGGSTTTPSAAEGGNRYTNQASPR